MSRRARGSRTLPKRLRWCGQVPEGGAHALEIGFVPTRSSVVGARWPQLPEPDEEGFQEVPRGRHLNGLLLRRERHGRILVQFEEPFAGGETVEFDLLFFGEKPQLLLASWLTGGIFPVSAIPSLTPEEELYDELDKIAAKGGPRAFLFELDRQTLKVWMELAGVPKPTQNLRLDAFNCLTPGLNERLRETLDGWPVPAITDSATLSLFADLFWGAAEAHFDSSDTRPFSAKVQDLGHTLERFAAGRLRLKSAITTSTLGDIWHFEPDSYFVFFFAEFAFAASEKGYYVTEFQQLLPYLVRMQRFFCERYLKYGGSPYGKITNYDEQPIDELKGAEFKDVVAALKTEIPVSGGFDAVALRGSVQEHLKLLASTMGDYPAAGASCSSS